MAGGGMCTLSGSNPVLTNCLLIGNVAKYQGGGMDNFDSQPELMNCTFLANRVMVKYGGAMHNYGSSPRLVNYNTPQNLDQRLRWIRCLSARRIQETNDGEQA